MEIWNAYGIWIIFTFTTSVGFLGGIVVGLNHINK